MLTRLLLAGVLAGAGVGVVVGQTDGAGSVPFDWASLVGGAVGSSPAAVVLAWRLNKADKETVGLRTELRDLHSTTLGMAERMAPILVEASRTLADVRAGMEATIDRTRPAEIDRVLTRLEDVARDIGTRGRP